MGCSLFVLLFAIIFLFIINSALISAVRINEIMYDPIQNEDYNEYIEIYNNENITLNLTGWKLCNNNLLAGYINKSDGILLNYTLILEPFQYALITDMGTSNTSGTEVYSNFNVSNNSLALHVDGLTLCGQLSNIAKNISILNSSGVIIDNVYYNKTLGWTEATGGKSLQKINVSAENLKENWQSCMPTPGRENLCQPTTNTPPNPQPNTTANATSTTQTKQGIVISLDYDSKIYNDEEFSVKIGAENLNDSDYDVKIWLEYDGRVLSEIYSKDEGKWVSGRYYVSGLSGPEDDSRTFNLRLNKDNTNFTGTADIIARLRKVGSSGYIEESDVIRVLGGNSNNSSEENIQNNQAIPLSEENEAIRLEKDIKSWKSKTEYLKEYALYGFPLFLAAVFIILIITWKKSKQYL